MSAIRDQIKEANRLKRMRLGQLVGERVTIPSQPDLVPMMVVLSEAEAQMGIAAAANMTDEKGNFLQDNMAGYNVRNRFAMSYDVFNSLRDPSDLTTKAFESVEQLTDTLDPSDIDKLSDELSLMMDYASPEADGITNKELGGLKKAFAQTDWNGLSGKRWAAVKLCCQVLLPELMVELLQAKQSGSGSTESSTEKNGKSESTLDAVPA